MSNSEPVLNADEDYARLDEKSGRKIGLFDADGQIGRCLRPSSGTNCRWRESYDFIEENNFEATEAR